MAQKESGEWRCGGAVRGGAGAGWRKAVRRETGGGSAEAGWRLLERVRVRAWLENGDAEGARRVAVRPGV